MTTERQQTWTHHSNTQNLDQQSLNDYKPRKQNLKRLSHRHRICPLTYTIIQCADTTGSTTSLADITARNASHATCQDGSDGAAKDGTILIASIDTGPLMETHTHQL